MVVIGTKKHFEVTNLYNLFVFMPHTKLFTLELITHFFDYFALAVKGRVERIYGEQVFTVTAAKESDRMGQKRDREVCNE